MGISLQIYVIGLTLFAGILVGAQKLLIAYPTAPNPARQIAYNMRTYHQSAVTYKIANPSVTGVIAAPPSFLSSEDRFTSCADAKHVVTFMGGASAGAEFAAGISPYMNEAVGQEVIQQSIAAPELGLISSSTKVTGYNGITTTKTSGVPGIGLFNGTQINTALGAVIPPAGCTVPNGVPAIVTQALP